MKIRKVFFCFTVLMTLVFFIGCSENSSQNDNRDNTVTNTRPVELPIEGMSCMACVAKVRNTLTDTDGIDDINVSLENNNTTFRYNPGKISLDKIEQAINEIGYKAGKPKELSK